MFLSFIKLFVVLALLTAGVDFVRAEVINSFTADYTIATDGLVTVVETIEYDFGVDERHGVYRTIINAHPQSATAWHKKRSIDLIVQSVTRNGEEAPFTVDRFGRELTIKIGDEESLISGIHTFMITYTLAGALSAGSLGAEFYYNVTGNEWEVPITLAVATVRGVMVSGKSQCYQGQSGDKTTCTSNLKEESKVTFVANNVAAGEGLTIATELDASKVTVAVHESTTWLLFGYALAFVWLTIVVLYVFRFSSSAKVTLPVIAQYEPYKEYLPMYTGVLADNKLDSRDITAGILYLAEQGFIKITKTIKKVLFIISVGEYEITLKRPLGELASQFLATLSGLLFAQTDAVGTTVLLSQLVDKRAANITLIQKLQKDLQADLLSVGFLDNKVPQFKKTLTASLIGMAVIFSAFLLVPNGIFLVIGVLIITVGILLCMYIPRRTTVGYEAKNHIEGFKLFLSVTDKERFDFHNAPEKSPELFMQYLPYAVALGVEAKWAKVFSGITIPQPDWYEGGNIAAFSAGTLTSDLGAFSTALSTNSGVSGSSGGGSSGGGGGGGGGGSW